MPAILSRADPPRADQLPPVPAGAPAELLTLRGPDGETWPEPVAEHLAGSIRDQWGPEEHVYGVLESRVGLALEYPLVNARPDGSVVIPVLDVSELPVRGRIVLPAGGGSRRIALLIDTSESANQRARLQQPGGGTEQVSVRDAALRAAIQFARRLLEQRAEYGHLLDYRATELMVVAFGEKSWSLVDPGTDLVDALSKLESFAAEGTRPEGRSDAVCALNLAGDWLLAPEHSGRSDVVLLTHGDLPFSNRFTDCARLADSREQLSCLETLNRSECSGALALDPEEGHSDIAQLFALARATRPRLRIFPVLFQDSRPPRFIREIASHSGGELIRVGVERGIEIAVEQLLMDDPPRKRVEAVTVRSLQAGASIETAVQPGDVSFSCEIALVEGPNDIEIDVRAGSEILGRYRYRVQMERDPLGDFLAEIRATNREIVVRAEDLAHAIEQEMQEVRDRSSARSLEIAVEKAAARGPEQPGPGENGE